LSAATTIRREREQRKKKEEEMGKPNRYRRKDASLISVLLRYKGASLADTLHADVAHYSNPFGFIGRHHP
jgi:hypothetical protein